MPQAEISPPSLRWTLHPAARHPAGAAALLVLVLGVGLGVRLWIGSVPAAAFAMVVLLLSVRAWLLPRTYTLDEDGAREDGWLSNRRGVTWGSVRRVTRMAHGVHLSPWRTPSRWLPDRGLYLRTDSTDRRDAAADFAKQRAAT